MTSLAKMCVGKTQYMSEEKAYGQAAKILRSANAPQALRAYKCPNCNWFHLTKRVK